MNKSKWRRLAGELTCTFFASVLLIILFQQLQLQPQLTLHIQTRNPLERSLQLYFDTGKGFNEREKITIHLAASEKWKNASFSLPNDHSIQRFMLSLGKNPSPLDIKKASISNYYQDLYRWKTIDLIKTLKSHNLTIHKEDQYLQLQPKKRDSSYIHMKKDSELSDCMASYWESSTIRNIWVIIVSILFFSALHFTEFFTLRVSRQKYIAIVGSAGFIALIFLPVASKPLKMNEKIKTTEKRVLTKKPVFDLSRLFCYPKEYEAYFNDNFELRNLLVRANNLLYAKVFQKSTLPQKLLMGKKQWFYFATGNIVQDHEGKCPFTTDELNTIQKNLETKQQWLAKKGISFYLTVAPNKQSIYPEHLPRHLKANPEKQRLNQLTAYLKKHSDIQIIDLRKDLQKEKQKRQVYQKTGSHWNNYGAFIGYTTLMARISQEYPILKPYSRDEFKIKQTMIPGADLTGMLSISDGYKEKEFNFKLNSLKHVKKGTYSGYKNPNKTRGLMVRECKGSSDLRMVMFRDSFMIAALPFVANHFDRSVYVWTNELVPQIIETEQPNIVIQEIVERNLYKLKEPLPKAIRKKL